MHGCTPGWSCWGASWRTSTPPSASSWRPRCSPGTRPMALPSRCFPHGTRCALLPLATLGSSGNCALLYGKGPVLPLATLGSSGNCPLLYGRRPVWRSAETSLTRDLSCAHASIGKPCFVGGAELQGRNAHCTQHLSWRSQTPPMHTWV